MIKAFKKNFKKMKNKLSEASSTLIKYLVITNIALAITGFIIFYFQGRI